MKVLTESTQYRMVKNMNDLDSLEQLFQTNLVASMPNQLFKSDLKQKLLERSAMNRKKVLYQWLALTLAGIVAGVALYGVAALLKKNRGKLICCGAGDSSELSS
jgi:hypothetical protein